MDAVLQSYIERLFTILAKRRDLQLDRDALKAVLFDVPRHLFIEQYYDYEAPDGIVQVASPEPTEKQLETIYSDRGLMIREEPHNAEITAFWVSPIIERK